MVIELHSRGLVGFGEAGRVVEEDDRDCVGDTVE